MGNWKGWEDDVERDETMMNVNAERESDESALWRGVRVCGAMKKDRE